MVSPGQPQEHPEEASVHLGSQTPMERDLTRTRGPWSPAPVEVSTSSPGQMTHTAAGQTKERQSFGRE